MTQAIQNDFPITNQYLNNIVSENCALKSIIAKVSCLVFPIIILLTFLVDLVSQNNKDKAGQAIELNVSLSEGQANSMLADKIKHLLATCTPKHLTQLEEDPRIQSIASESLHMSDSVRQNLSQATVPLQELPPLRNREDAEKAKRLLADMSTTLSLAMVSVVAKRMAACSPEEFAGLTKNLAIRNFKGRVIDVINVTGYPLNTPENCERARKVKQLLVEISSNSNLTTISLVAQRAVVCSPEEFIDLLTLPSLRSFKDQLAELIHVTGYPLDTMENCERALKVKQLLALMCYDHCNSAAVSRVAQRAAICSPEEFVELMNESPLKPYKDRLTNLIEVNGF